MPFRPSIFDALIHPGGLTDQDLRDLAFFGVEGAIAVAGEDAPPGSSDELHEYLLRLTDEMPARMRAAGIAPFVLLGIPPRRIPDRGFEELLARLPSLFARTRVVGIGTIGIDTEDEREAAAFVRQLELAESLGARVVVQTPSRDKVRITRRVLGILRDAGIAPERVLVAQTTAETVRLVRACGFHAGLAVHPRRLRAEEVVRIVRGLGSGGLVLASDAGAGPGDLLALPRTVHLLERAGLSAGIVRRVARDNALAFFGIDPSAL